MGRGAPKTWEWQDPAQGWDTANAGRRSKGKDKGKGSAQAKDGGQFPSYDAGGTSGSSAPASSANGAKDLDLRSALNDVFAQHNLDIPKELQAYLQIKPQQLGDQLQSDQKALNAKRKLLSKIDRLEKAAERKKEQWHQFRAQMREHLAKEQTRFDTEIEEIKAAMEQAQLQLDKLISGTDPDPNAETEETAMELEQALALTKDEKNHMFMTPIKNKEPKDPDTIEALRQAQLGQQQLAQQLQTLQQQMLYMTNALTPTAGTPSPSKGFDAPLQKPFTPVKPRHIQPPGGPYTKVEPPAKEATPKVPKENKMTDIEVLSD